MLPEGFDWWWCRWCRYQVLFPGYTLGELDSDQFPLPTLVQILFEKQWHKLSWQLFHCSSSLLSCICGLVFNNLTATSVHCCDQQIAAIGGLGWANLSECFAVMMSWGRDNASYELTHSLVNSSLTAPFTISPNLRGVLSLQLGLEVSYLCSVWAVILTDSKMPLELPFYENTCWYNWHVI